MRVQPHLPSRPFTAMVIESDGFAAFACSAANNPAPPAPRIRMSVRRRRGCKSTTEAHARAFGIDELRERDAVLGCGVAGEAHACFRQRTMHTGDVVAVQAEMRRARGVRV